MSRGKALSLVAQRIRAHNPESIAGDYPSLCEVGPTPGEVVVVV
jgi:hypothetical protein